jgi:hypothetical protein
LFLKGANFNAYFYRLEDHGDKKPPCRHLTRYSKDFLTIDSFGLKTSKNFKKPADVLPIWLPVPRLIMYFSTLGQKT